jgi:hypothetical protein
MLGLDAQVIAYDTWTLSSLKKKFPNEMPKLQTMNALRKEGAGHSVFGPNPRQRELRVLTDRGDRMHYVMIRPGRTVMDPAPKDIGREHNSIDVAKTALKMHGTGLSVFIQR